MSDNELDYYYFKMQTQLLGLNLQLAEAEEKPKRTGDFDSTYKTATGVEVTIKRSPDGKFAHKGGDSNNAATTDTAPLDSKVARENGRAVREILTGKVGDDLKKDLAANFEHRPIFKEVIEKVDFAEVTKGDADALTNINNFMQRKFKEAVNAVSQLGLEVAVADMGVAAFTARSLIFQTATVGALIPAITVLAVKQGMIAPPEAIKHAVTIAPVIFKDLFTSKNLTSTIRFGTIFEGISLAVKLARSAAKKPDPLLIEPKTDRAVIEAMRGTGGNALKDSLIASAAQTPGVAEGIKSTNIEDVIKGDKDPFSNAADFMHAKIDEAVNAVSENKVEIAIGAAIVGLAVAITAVTTIAAATATRAVASTVLGLITGKGFSESVNEGLKRLTPKAIKNLATTGIFAGVLAFKMAKTGFEAIKELVDASKLAKSGGIGAKSFGKKEEAVKKLVTEEGLDYEKVLRAIARRKEEPPNPKKAIEAQKEILKLERDIQEGANKAANLTRDKVILNRIETAQITAIVKKETEARNEIIEKRGELEQAEGRGFSISRRLNELADIAAKEGKNSPSYKWRANVVKAEIAYGDKLDKLDNFGGYNNLLSTMKKPKPASGSYTILSNGDKNNLSKLFNNNGSPTQTPATTQTAVVSDARRAGEELQNYLVTPINVKIDITGGLSCSFAGGNNKYSYLPKYSAAKHPEFKLFTETDMFKDKNIDGYINIGDVSVDTFGNKSQGYNQLASTKEHIKEITWHETGHFLEIKLDKVNESVAFREDKALETPSDRKVVPPQGLSAGSQDYALGGFYSPYIGLRMKGIGKYANTDRATEVLSSGMELLSSPSMARRAAKADRETMLYALAAMNEKVKD